MIYILRMSDIGSPISFRRLTIPRTTARPGRLCWPEYRSTRPLPKQRPQTLVALSSSLPHHFRGSLLKCESPIVVAMSKKIIISFKFSDIRATTEASCPSSAKQRISEALLSECEPPHLRYFPFLQLREGFKNPSCPPSSLPRQSRVRPAQNYGTPEKLPISVSDCFKPRKRRSRQYRFSSTTLAF